LEFRISRFKGGWRVMGLTDLPHPNDEHKEKFWKRKYKEEKKRRKRLEKLIDENLMEEKSDEW
jgi:hypothetical protein